MRFIIYGAGAIGGTVAVRLHQSGHDVAVIARGAHRQAIAERGLTLLTPTESVNARVPVFGTPQEAGLRAGDVALLAVKGQDTAAALQTLRDAAPGGRIPVVLLQNGVENERVALRLFPDVYACVVMMAAEHLESGTVICYTAKVSGQLDIGRYPSGTDELCEQICAALAGSQIVSEPQAAVMTLKFAKLLLNLTNGVQAICGPGDESTDPEGAYARLVQRLRDEGESVLAAAGIDCESPEVGDRGGRWQRWGIGEVSGHPHSGSSTWQSITRGTGTVETDFLNGEIVLLARQLGLTAPANELVQRLTRETAVRGLKPGWMPAEAVLAEIEAAD